MLKIAAKLFEFDFEDGMTIGFLLGVIAVLCVNWYLQPRDKEKPKP